MNPKLKLLLWLLRSVAKEVQQNGTMGKNKEFANFLYHSSLVATGKILQEDDGVFDLDRGADLIYVSLLYSFSKRPD